MTAGSPAPDYTLMQSESFVVVQALGESPDVSWKYPFCSNPGNSVCHIHFLIFSSVYGKKVMHFPFSFCEALPVVTFTQTNAKNCEFVCVPLNMVE